MKNVNVFFTGDTHFGQINIVRALSTWETKNECRPFQTLEEMDDAIIDNINAVVGPNDHLYHVGDVAFGHGPNNITAFRNRIRCKTFYLFLGNHDHYIRSSTSPLRSLFTKVRERETLTINGQVIALGHFPELIWDKHNSGAWHLHGHTHNGLNVTQDKAYKDAMDLIFHDRKVMDVGIDAHPEFRPFHFDEIKAIMDTRKIIQLDHHNTRI